jgi:hypothetical protein
MQIWPLQPVAAFGMAALTGADGDAEAGTANPTPRAKAATLLAYKAVRLNVESIATDVTPSFRFDLIPLP